jgi:hypothetical protein
MKTRARDHNNDSDDIPAGLDPVMLQTRMRTRVRDHNNDSDDIPEGQDPIMLQTGVRRCDMY